MNLQAVEYEVHRFRLALRKETQGFYVGIEIKDARGELVAKRTWSKSNVPGPSFFTCEQLTQFLYGGRATVNEVGEMRRILVQLVGE